MGDGRSQDADRQGSRHPRRTLGQARRGTRSPGGTGMTRRFAMGDEVTVRDATSMFHTRTQAFTRGRTGTVVEFRPDWVIPEDEAWGTRRPRARWPNGAVLRGPLPTDRPLAQIHRFDIDTLETEVA